MARKPKQTPVETCADCVHEYACKGWTHGQELSPENASKCDAFEAVRDTAAYLIGKMEANGVTVQRWVPVTERLPDIKKETGQIQITETVQATDGTESFFGCFKVYKYDGSWVFVCANEDVDLCVTDEITHWIPLHDLPKEDANA